MKFVVVNAWHDCLSTVLELITSSCCRNMSDDSGNGEQQQEFKKFFVDHAKSSRSACKKCKQKIDTGLLRLAKSGYNPFGPGPMKMWHHVNCLFEVFAAQRRTTARIETPEDIEGWSDLEKEDQEEILKYLPDCKGNCHVVLRCLTALSLRLFIVEWWGES